MKVTALQGWISAYILFLCAYCVWSYALTDPNLVLTGWPVYWNFQQTLWRVLYPDKLTLVVTYLVLVFGLTVSYFKIVKLLAASSVEYILSPKRAIAWLTVCVVPLMVSYNALSHDIFNYLFNGKMIVHYGVSPYTTTAIDFPNDLWTRFMHNTHTFAPYGPVWNWVSAAVYSIGGGKFTITWLLLKILQVGGLIVLYRALQYTARALFNRSLQTHELAVLFLNPLFLLETVANAHNDIWMAIPAVWAVGYAASRPKKTTRFVHILLVIALLAVSAGVKYATILIVPFVLLVLFADQLVAALENVLQKRFPLFKLMSFFARGFVLRQIQFLTPFLCSVILCMPLFTDRSQQFHPWYLVWVLVWLPLISFDWWKRLITIVSVTSLLRYVPWLFVDGFTEHTLLYQKFITWSGVGIFILLYLYKLIPGKDSNLK